MKLLTIFIILSVFVNQDSWAKVSREDLEMLSDAISKAYNDELVSRDEYVEINPPYGVENPWQYNILHASYVRVEVLGDDSQQMQLPYDNIKVVHMLTLFGGLGELELMSRDGLALIACHELGHGIAGPPLKETGASTEGQSDYFATADCLEKVFQHLPIEDDLTFHERAIQAIEFGLIPLLEEVEGVQTSVNSRSDEVAQELDLSPGYYPSPQCRIDTLVDGISDLGRPICWYPVASDN
ncbi:MAG: hypothetical protein ISR65_17690 [Bacteriovoracaceae bacterium]|nr:hypothetical protein [Bacteriovoracaceae bacterium]